MAYQAHASFEKCYKDSKTEPYIKAFFVFFLRIRGNNDIRQ